MIFHAIPKNTELVQSSNTLLRRFAQVFLSKCKSKLIREQSDPKCIICVKIVLPAVSFLKTGKMLRPGIQIALTSYILSV